MKIRAPLDFVYNWCTDFRIDDPKITGSNSKRLVLEKSRDRAIYVALNNKIDDYGRGGRIYLVKMEPPNTWRLQAHGNGFDTIGEYQLTRISSKDTQLRITFTHTYYDKSVMPTKVEKEMDSKRSWTKYVNALEKDFLGSTVETSS